MWTDVPSAPTAPDKVPDNAVIPIGVQPRLQLSLDLLMMENYAGLVSQHAGGGSWETGALGDGTFRHGAERAVIANIHGLWSQGAGEVNDFRNYPATPAHSRAMMWLGVITASMFNAVTFDSAFSWAPITQPVRTHATLIRVSVKAEQTVTDCSASLVGIPHAGWWMAAADHPGDLGGTSAAAHALFRSALWLNGRAPDSLRHLSKMPATIC
jgi:hypothetical protein